MTRDKVERALANAIDAESQIGLRWRPGVDIAPVVFRRWSSFERRHQKSKHVTLDDRMHDLAKGLQAHFEPDVPHTPFSEWLHLAGILVKVLASEVAANDPYLMGFGES